MSTHQEVSKNITQHVKGRTKFDFYRGGYLYYTTDTGLTFPISISDTAGATFLAEDKSLFFMRWIRKYLKSIEEENQNDVG